MQIKDITTIAAIATAQGLAGIGIIRISGPRSKDILDQIFIGRSNKAVESHKLQYGIIRNEQGTILDEVLAVVFKSPHSYTGEDLVEINCHGSNYILTEVLQLIYRKGAVPAQAGEFTLRAYLNGKMDLSQAEAVADLIHSETALQHRLAMNQMKGGIKDQISILRQSLIEFASLLELELDFGEEDVEFANRTKLLQLVQEIITKITDLNNSFSLGNAIKFGIATVIAGRPNAGKSTLLNALLQENRAIVSEIAGTTRDTIEEKVNIGGILFRLIDTAGIRKAEDQIEALGVERSIDSIQKSSIMLYVADVAQLRIEALREDLNKLLQPNQKILIIANKTDLLPDFKISDYANEYCSEDQIIAISALNLSNVEMVKEKILNLAVEHQSTQDLSIVVNARHRAALDRSLAELLEVKRGLETSRESDLIAQSLRLAIYELGSVTGQVSSDELLGNIFGKFCIGK